MALWCLVLGVINAEGQTPRTTTSRPTTPQRDPQQEEIQRITRMARQAESDGNYERAVELWRAVEKLSPGNFSAYNGLKRGLTALQRFDELLDYLSEMQRNNATSRYGLDRTFLLSDQIDVILMTGKQDNADKITEDAIRSNPSDARLYQDISRAYFRNGLIEKALDILRTGRKNLGNPREFALDIAKWCEARMDWKGAAVEYMLYLEETPTRLEYVIGALADIAVQPSMEQTVFKLIEEKLHSDDTAIRDLYRRVSASLHFRSRRFAQSYQIYLTLEQQDRFDGRELLGFAQSVVSEGEFHLAITVFNEVLGRAKDLRVRSDAFLGKGVAAEGLMLPDTSISAYSSIVDGKGYPEDAIFEALFRLGQIRLGFYNDPKGARDHFHRAVQLGNKARLPSNRIDEVTIEVALTWAKEQRLDQAEKTLLPLTRRMGQRYTPASTARYYLARIFFWRGEFEEMEREINNLLSTDPASSYANECLSLKAMLRDFKTNPEITLSFGSADWHLFYGDTVKGVQTLDSLTQNKVTFAQEEAFWRLHRYYVKIQDFQKGLDYLNRIIGLPDALRRDLALITAGEIALHLMGKPELAEKYWEELLFNYPDSPSAEKARRALNSLNLQTNS